MIDLQRTTMKTGLDESFQSLYLCWNSPAGIHKLLKIHHSSQQRFFCRINYSQRIPLSLCEIHHTKTFQRPHGSCSLLELTLLILDNDLSCENSTFPQFVFLHFLENRVFLVTMTSAYYKDFNGYKTRLSLLL